MSTMRSAKLQYLIRYRYGTVLNFAERNGFKYSTLCYQINNDAKLNKMSIDQFMKLASALGKTADELIEYLETE